MTYQSLASSVPVPRFIKRQLFGYLLPGEDLDTIFDTLDPLVDPGGEDSIFTRKKMSVTVSKPKMGTLDMFFPKICKQEPLDRADSSESEFELTTSRKSHKSNSVSNNENGEIPSPKLSSKLSESPHVANSVRPSIDSLCFNERSLFHSTVLGKTNENIPLCGSDYATSDSDSKDESNKEISNVDQIQSLDQNKIKNEELNRMDLLEKLSEKTPNPEYMTNPSNKKTAKDLFSIENSDSAVLTEDENSQDIFSELQKESEPPKTNAEEHIHSESEDEMIPLTQEPVSSIRFDLDPRKNAQPKKKPSNSPKSIRTEKNSITALEKSPTHVEVQSKHKTLKEQILNEMTNVLSLPNLESSEELLHIGDINEDIEVFLIQCPKNVPLSSLENVELPLDGLSSVPLEKEGKTAQFECISIRENSDRNVNLVLPDSQLKQVKIGSFPLAGNIILSEATEQPVLALPQVEPTTKVPFPEGLEDLCSTLTVSDSSFHVPDVYDGFEKKEKKKKKRKRECLEGVANEESTIEDEIVIPKKKRKHKEAEGLSILDHSIKTEPITPQKKSNQEEHEGVATEESTIEDEVVIPKKKRKHKEAEEIFTGDCAIQNEIVNKKKKRKHEEIEDTAEECVSHSINASPERKKKKKSSTGLSTLDHTIKTEAITPQKKSNQEEHEETHMPEESVSNALKSLKKKKKKSYEPPTPDYSIKKEVISPEMKKEYENYEEAYTAEESTWNSSELYPGKKKKKKKDSNDGGNIEMVDTFNASVAEGLLDEMVRKKKKKKHRVSGDASYADESGVKSSFDFQSSINISEISAILPDLQNEGKVKKKKSKNKSIEGADDCFIKPDLSEVSFTEKHRKKHKKKSID